jgi:hypothetical protein
VFLHSHEKRNRNVCKAAECLSRGSRWKAIAKERTEALAANEADAQLDAGALAGEGASQDAGSGRAGDAGASGQLAAKPAGFPASIVKRIMCLDEEVDRCAPAPQ